MMYISIVHPYDVEYHNLLLDVQYHSIPFYVVVQHVYSTMVQQCITVHQYIIVWTETQTLYNTPECTITAFHHSATVCPFV